MKRLNINFLFLILAVISLLFLEGGLLFRVFKDYLGENHISSLVGVICLQAGFFAIALNIEENKYKIPPQWLFVIFGDTLLVCYNIYHVIELLPTLKSNGVPQFVIGISTGLFIPFLGGLLLDLLAAKIRRIEEFKVWKDTLYQLAKEESTRILGEKAKLEAQINDFWAKANDKENDLQQEIIKRDKEILTLQQDINGWKKRNADLSVIANNRGIKYDAIVLEIANVKTAHANELLAISQEKGENSGELERLRTLNKIQGDELGRERKKYNELNSLYKDAENRAKLLEGVNDSLKTLKAELSAKDLELNELMDNFTAKNLYEKVIVPWNRGMKIGKNETTEAGETRYSLIEKELGSEFLPIVYSLERGTKK